ncbi:DNA glycosylase/AP lyase ROS1-like [Lolium rigidum]|uniref:DNA glycosylase/AP lyase ROS1-like n=1 Tax=Lolium rigidum TaxID=89674 RepID=UPI001F5D50F3|nr:DNA glycosylase/AP lyase ROS1-like [Lolium rigidum]XP_051191475.1 DNA glycosylase/AP lyase ROS1-like [Lolium perenne]XP_051191476.1 DNA glycosylase/AP lyase ROS1-like [Lolium perenne]
MGIGRRSTPIKLPRRGLEERPSHCLLSPLPARLPKSTAAAARPPEVHGGGQKSDLGSGLLMPPPVTTDVGRSQSSTDGRFSCSAVPASASIDFGMFDKHGFISPIGESAPAGTREPSPSPQDADSFGKIAPPGEGAAAASATGPGATPYKDFGMFDKHGFIYVPTSIGESAPGTGEASTGPPGEGNAAANATSSGAAPVPTPDTDFGMFDKHGFIYVPSSIGESAPGTGEGLSSPQESDSSDKIEEGAAADNATSAAATKAAATPIPSPYKGEDAHWRPRKKSTKGVARFKLVKDKRPTPAKVGKTPVTKDPGESSVGGVADHKSTKRKLDVDAIEVITGSFNRARLVENLMRLANMPDGVMKKKKKKKTSAGEQAIVPYAAADMSCSALVPVGTPGQLAMVRHANHGKKVRAKVVGLDAETLRVHGVLAKWDEAASESFEGLDIGSGPEWDEVRRKYKLLVDWFISVVKDLFGSRKFSQWGGSVLDSVVGTFLTQNVADNLSSNAFMTLAAKFPMDKRKDNAEECSYEPPLTDDVLNCNEASSAANVNSLFSKPADCEKVGCTDEVKGQYGEDYKTIMENFLTIIQEKDVSTWEKDDLLNLVKSKSGKEICTERTLRKFIASLRLEDTAHWDKLRVEACIEGYDSKSKTRVPDKVDWEAVQKASLVDIAKCIAGRGQHYLLALRIQAFLTRIKKDHGSFDLDWLRCVPRESAKKYLLSVNGLGAKSVDCIRLLSLNHKAFPVDVNVARIVTRLEWVELQCCDEEFHLVDLYPLMEDVQSYLWPRLCTIDKEKLYELHCLMITFGKVICTKVDPNCNACPFRSGCRWYRSKRTRPLLPPAEEHVHGHSEGQASMITSERLLLSNGSCTPSQQVCQLEIDESRTAGRQPTSSCEPIIEVPPSPEYEYEALDEQGYPSEDDLVDIEDIMSGVGYDVEINLCSNKPMGSNGSWTPSCGKGLALNDSRYTQRKLKNIGHLRTEHHAYVLPDDHAILEEFEDRIPEDPCHYLLVVIPCPDDHMVKGTVLIPCRTASEGNFPLNGTYFQEHEVFADHASSCFPITIPRECIWELERRIVYFGSSIHSITKGQPRQDIEDCFKRGHVCVRGFDRQTRYPRRLCTTLHSIAGEKKESSSEQKESASSK